MATDVVVIFALEREAAPFRKLATRDRLPVRIVVGGVGAVAAKLVCDAGLVISAGFCGALDPKLRVGDVLTVRRSHIVSEDDELMDQPGAQATNDAASVACAPGWYDAARLCTVAKLVATTREKQQLRERTSADIVDMEAAHIATVCASRGIPFLAMKAVSDTADTALSPRLVKLLTGGRVSIPRAATMILVQPRILGEFRRLSRDTRFAAKRLAERLGEICRTQSAVV